VSSLLGAADLHKRFKALNAAIEPGRGVTFPSQSVAYRWQQGTAKAARTRIPVRTGETRRSVRPGNWKGRPAVLAKYTVNFIDAGSKAHDEPRSMLTPTGRVSRRKRNISGKTGQPLRLKYQMGGRTVFSKKVHKPRIAARPFKKWAAEEGLIAINWLTFVVGVWNRAA